MMHISVSYVFMYNYINIINAPPTAHYYFGSFGCCWLFFFHYRFPWIVNTIHTEPITQTDWSQKSTYTNIYTEKPSLMWSSSQIDNTSTDWHRVIECAALAHTNHGKFCLITQRFRLYVRTYIRCLSMASGAVDKALENADFVVFSACLYTAVVLVQAVVG